MTAPDPAFEAWQERARAADVLDVATRLCGAALKGRGRERTGPCPRCGGTDRFSVNTQKQLFNCRGAAGGSVIDMVMHCQAVSYLAACEIITGAPPPAKGTQLTDEARAAAEQAKAESAARAEKREADNAWYRDRERRRTHDMWNRAHPLAGSSAADYLTRRGLMFPDTPEGRDRLKCIEAMPYWLAGNDKGAPRCRAPAMVAPIVDAARKFRGLHFTYLDLGQPKGKLQVADPDRPGKFLEAKKARGSKAGNRVELIGPREPKVLVLGEGIEKVLAVWMALVQVSGERAELANTDQLISERTAFWSACDLGNLAGPAAETVAHPTLTGKGGRPLRVAGPEPDRDKPGIAIPDSVTDLVLLGDSTSEPFATQLAMCRAAARYARPGRTVRVAWAPAGKDFDDLWREWADQPGDGDGRKILADHARMEIAQTIAKIVSHAKWPAMPELAVPAAAPARDRAPKVRPDKTSHPNDLPSAIDVESTRADPPAAAVAAAPPPHAGAAASAQESEKSSRGGDPSRVSGEREASAGAGARSANRARWGGPPRKFGDGLGALDKWLAFFPQTELGLIERYVQRERGRLMYCAALGWFWWDGTRWARDADDGRAISAGHDTVRAIQDEAAAIRGTEHDATVSTRKVGKGKDAEEIDVWLSDTLEGFGRNSETKSAMTLHKHAAPYLSQPVEKLDADKFAINILNGTLLVRPLWREALPEGWRSLNQYIRLKPHDPDDLITKLAPVRYDRDARCSGYDAALATWQPDEPYREFLDDWDGYSMTGDATEQRLVLNLGGGKNGKSTYIDIKHRILGEYAETIPIASLIDAGKQRAAGQASPDLAMLRRIRSLVTSEPKKGWKLDEGLIKDLTGGDKVKVRELHCPYFDLRPEFKLSVAGNHEPSITAGEEESGMWRRVIRVDWKVVIPKASRDRHLADKLIEEASGILNRWLAGLSRWMQHGLRIPEAIAASTEQFRVDSDLIGQFLTDCTTRHEGDKAQVTALYNLFVAWARANAHTGRHDWTPIGFSKAMKERGFISAKNNVLFWLGLKMVKTVNDFVDQDGKPFAPDAAAARPSGDAKAPARAWPREAADDDDDRDGF